MASQVSKSSDVWFVRRVLIVIGLGAFALALYQLSNVLLLVFGAVLVAVLMRVIARPLQTETSMSERVSLVAAVVGMILILGTHQLPLRNSDRGSALLVVSFLTGRGTAHFKRHSDHEALCGIFGRRTDGECPVVWNEYIRRCGGNSSDARWWNLSRFKTGILQARSCDAVPTGQPALD